MTNRPAPRLSILSLALLAVIFAPLAVMLYLGTMRAEFGRDPFPGVPRSASDVARLPGRFQAAFNAHFGMREPLLRLHGELLYRGLGVSPNPRLVALGPGNWLFLNNESMDEYRKLDPFSPGELAAWGDQLEREAAACRAAGVAHLFVIAPDKHTIYGEGRIPDAFRRQTGPSRLDQLIDSLDAEGRGVALLDLRPALIEAARDLGPLYFETDSHWNTLGAAVAAGELLDALAEQGVATEPLTIAPSPDHSVELNGGDEARLIGLQESIRQRFPRPEVRVGGRTVDLEIGRPPRETVEVNGAPMEFSHANPEAPESAPVILYIHDSTGVALRAPLAEASGRLEARWTTPFDPALLEELRPTVVIHQLIERRLHNLDPAELMKPR